MINKQKGRGFNFERVGNQAYDASAQLGRISNWFTLIAGIIATIVMIIIGSMLLNMRKTEWKAMTGRIKSVKCRERNIGDDNRIECDAEVDYAFQNKQYTTTMTVKERANKGEDVYILIDPTNPHNVEANKRAMKTGFGWGLIAFALIILFGAALRFYLVRNNELAAAAHGASTAWGILT